ncbi:MAG: hypothetical protein QW776_06655 [Candidatus Nitrosocaldus sp.]
MKMEDNSREKRLYSAHVTISLPVINLNLLLERSIGCILDTDKRDILSVNGTTLILTIDSEGFDDTNILV